MCLADFVSPEADWIGGFAVTTGHGIDHHPERFKAAHDDYSDILLKALADRLAEAFAERLHEHARKTLWGYAPDEPLSNEDLMQEKYRASARRRATPRAPRQPEARTVPPAQRRPERRRQPDRKLRDDADRGVSGYYFAHPEAAFFGVARIGRDQLEDYAKRRGVAIEQAESG